MMTGTITDDQARALAHLVAALRPGWDVAGIRSALSSARHRAPAHELAIAAIRCTQGDARTPAVIAMDGPHWRTPGASTTTAPSRTEKCPEVGHGSFLAWNCGACRAEDLAADDAQPTPTTTPDPERAAIAARGAQQVRQALATARQETTP